MAVAVVAGERGVAIRIGDQGLLVVGVVGRGGGVTAGVLDCGLVAVGVVAVGGGAGGNRRPGAACLGDRGLLAVGVVGGDGGVVPGVRPGQVPVRGGLASLLAVAVVGVGGLGDLGAIPVRGGGRGQVTSGVVAELGHDPIGVDRRARQGRRRRRGGAG